MISFLYSHIQLCITTLAFLSWIPIPNWGATNKNLSKMGMYFPITGAFLGSVSALTLYCADMLFPYSVAVALTWFVYGWITGAFHEDGLADVADSMGGYVPQKRLEIMRDSRIGAYGSFALISSYILRFAALSAVSPDYAIRNLIAFASVSRLAGVFFLTKTKADDFPPDSMNRTISFSQQWISFFLGLFFAIIIVGITLPSNYRVIPFVVILFPLCARCYFLSKLGCVTGDCAGFVIHCTETILHVLATAML